MMTARKPHLVIRLAAGGVTLEAWRRGALVWALPEEPGAPEHLAGVFDRWADERDELREGYAVRVLVERPWVQLRHLVDVPAVRGGLLKQLVQTHAARYFRRNGSPLITDAGWIVREKERVAQICAMEALTIEALAAAAEAAGVRIVSVTPVDAPALSLLPPSLRAAQRGQARHALLRWSAAAVIAWGLVAGLGVLHLALEQRRVDRELARLEEPAAALATLTRQMRSAREMIDAMAATERGGRELPRWLGSIGAALPDSAFIGSLSLTAVGAGTIAGYARNASAVIANLRQVPGLPSPRLDGRITRQVLAGAEWERFTVVFGDSAAPGGRRGP